MYLFIDEFRIDILTVHNCARLIGNTIDNSDVED